MGKILKYLAGIDKIERSCEKQLEIMSSELKKYQKEADKYKKRDLQLCEYKIDVQRFLREQDYSDFMDDAEYKEFLSEASQVEHNRAFKTVIRHLTNIQASHSILQAADSPMIMFDRAGINNNELLLKEFERLDGYYRDLSKPEEKFDKYEAI